MALFGATGKEVIFETRRLAGMISLVLILVSMLKAAECVLMAMTISSREQLPALSPRPFTAHSTCLAPFLTPAKELAVARPRSSWQWVEKQAFLKLGTCFWRYWK